MRPFLFSIVLALAACGGTSDPGDAKTPSTSDGRSADSKTPPSSGNDAVSSPPSDPKTPDPNGPTFECRLPAPVSSDDACSKDADCAPATPCHARACVAASKATPRTPDTVCTMNIDCQSADVNPCSCYQGRCALVPKNP